MRICACGVHVLCMHCIIRQGPGRGHREKQFLIATLISKIVDLGNINFDCTEKSTMIYLSFAALTVWC